MGSQRASVAALSRTLPEIGLSATRARLLPLAARRDGDVFTEPQDFFIFIQDYDWSLRYRINKAADSSLDLEKPLQMDWVKLRTPVRDPAELQEMSDDERFDLDVLEPVGHNGFMYHVTRAVGQGVEAMINFLDGRDLKLLVEPDGIRVLWKGDSKNEESQGESPWPSAPSVTHCWVKCLGLPLWPMVQSVTFYNVEHMVVALQA